MARLFTLTVVLAFSLKADEFQWEKHFDAGQALLRDAGDYSGAAREFDLALVEAERFGPQDVALPVTLTNRAVIDVRLGHYREADVRYRRAIAIYEKYHPHLSGGLATTLQDFAILKIAERQWSAAGKLYLRAHDLLIATVGPNDLAVAENLLATGELAMETHSYLKAEDAFIAAREVFKRAGRSDSLNGADLDNNFAMLYRETGRSDKSDDLFAHAIAVYQRNAPLHANFAIVLRNYADRQTDRGDFRTAEDAFRRALNICGASLAPDSPETGVILGAYGQFLAKTKRREEAKLVSDRARKILTQSFRAGQGDKMVDWRDLKGR